MPKQEPRLEGNVQDTSGAVIPGAKVSVVDVKIQQRSEQLSTAQGLFTFPSLQPGTYTLTAESNGFRTEILSSLELNAAAVVNQVIKLQVGMSTETISVTARDEVVQTTDSQRGTSITMRDIDTLPQLAALRLLSPHFNRASLLIPPMAQASLMSTASARAATTPLWTAST